jgi:hypothetical protein
VYEKAREYPPADGRPSYHRPAAPATEQIAFAQLLGTGKPERFPGAAHQDQALIIDCNMPDVRTSGNIERQQELWRTSLLYPVLDGDGITCTACRREQPGDLRGCTGSV